MAVTFLILNRRGEGASFEDEGLFRRVMARAQKLSLPVFVTLNGFYTPDQYPHLFRLAAFLERLRAVRGLIVSDIGFLLALKRRGFRKDIHLSTLAASFNSRALAFYSDLGVRRIILDRHLTSRETQRILARAGQKVDVEIFIVSGSCGVFSDGLCTLTHCMEQPDIQKAGKFLYTRSFGAELDDKGCSLFARLLAERRFDVLDSYCGDAHSFQGVMDSKQYINYGCRVCELYDLKSLPVRSLKIAGRGMDTSLLARLVSLVALCREYLPKAGSRADYRKYCRHLFSELALNGERACTRFDCYFSKP